MDYGIFIYNVFLIIFFTTNVAGFCFLYLKSKQQNYLWVAVMFSAYIMENGILYMTEFFESFSAYYNAQSISSPTLKTLLSVVIFASYLLIIKGIFPDAVTWKEWTVYTFFILALFLLPSLPFSRVGYWLYFTLSQLMTLYLLARGSCFLDRQEKKQAVPYARKMRQFIWISVLFHLAIIVEDLVVIFNFDVISPMETRINQRNFCEDLHSIYLAAFALHLLIDYFSAPTASTISPEIPLPLPEEEPGVLETLPSKLDKILICAQRYHLTGREQEILELLVGNKTNQEISDQLFISLGTVKTHIHNIYQKVGITRRQQMLQLVDELVQTEHTNT